MALIKDRASKPGEDFPAYRVIIPIEALAVPIHNVQEGSSCLYFSPKSMFKARQILIAGWKAVLLFGVSWQDVRQTKESRFA